MLPPRVGELLVLLDAAGASRLWSDVVGVDLGGTKVAAALLNGGRLGDSVIEPTNRSSATALLQQLVALVARVQSGEVRAVGIGVPSVVEFETGPVVSSVNVPLADLPLRQLLGDRLGAPTFIDNDATVAALAEAHDEQLCLGREPVKGAAGGE